MHSGRIIRYLAVLTAFFGVTATSRAGADVIANTLGTLWEYAAQHANPAWSLSFQLSENDVNAYLKRVTQAHQRPGLTGAEVHFLGPDKLGVHVDLNLVEVCAWVPDDCKAPQLDPKGTLSIEADLTVKVVADQVTVTFDSLRALHSDLPEAAIRSLLASAASHQPEHFEILKPMKLPFNFKQLEIQANMLVGHL